jgi:hypothetical protein
LDSDARRRFAGGGARPRAAGRAAGIGRCVGIPVAWPPGVPDHGAMVRDRSACTVHIMAAAPSAPRASPSARRRSQRRATGGGRRNGRLPASGCAKRVMQRGPADFGYPVVIPGATAPCACRLRVGFSAKWPLAPAGLPPAMDAAPSPSARGGRGDGPRHSRRTAAKLCRAVGGELEQVQLLLGDASVQTTERYLGTKRDLGARAQRWDQATGGCLISNPHFFRAAPLPACRQAFDHIAAREDLFA